MVMADQADFVINEEQQRTAAMDASIPYDGNFRRRERERMEKYQGLSEELERAWKVRGAVVTLVTTRYLKKYLT